MAAVMISEKYIDVFADDLMNVLNSHATNNTSAVVFFFNAHTISIALLDPPYITTFLLFNLSPNGLSHLLLVLVKIVKTIKRYSIFFFGETNGPCSFFFLGRRQHRWTVSYYQTYSTPPGR